RKRFLQSIARLIAAELAFPPRKGSRTRAQTVGASPGRSCFARTAIPRRSFLPGACAVRNWLWPPWRQCGLGPKRPDGCAGRDAPARRSARGCLSTHRTPRRLERLLEAGPASRDRRPRGIGNWPAGVVLPPGPGEYLGPTHPSALAPYTGP